MDVPYRNQIPDNPVVPRDPVALVEKFCRPCSLDRGNPNFYARYCRSRNQGVSNHPGPAAVGGPTRHERSCVPPRCLTSFSKGCRDLVETRFYYPSHVWRARVRCAPEDVGDGCASPMQSKANASAYAPEILFMHSLDLTSLRIRVRWRCRPSTDVTCT